MTHNRRFTVERGAAIRIGISPPARPLLAAEQGGGATRQAATHPAVQAKLNHKKGAKICAKHAKYAQMIIIIFFEYY